MSNETFIDESVADRKEIVFNESALLFETNSYKNTELSLILP
jgi:hypothetical protein